MTAGEFGSGLRAYREAHFLTQKQIAALLGLSPNHISALEHGKKQPRASTIAAFERLTRKDESTEPVWSDGMSEDEVKRYTLLWRELKRLEPQQEKEILTMFFRILDWL